MSAEARDAIPSLDGVRALAVSVVFLAHTGLDGWVPGGLGVTIFFVLSGYLITTLLRAEHDRTGAIRLRAFYLRRALRLMPPMLIVVVAAGLLSLSGAIGGGFTPAGLASVLLYFANYHLVAENFGGVPDGLGVFWSLAVEEHYYLLYPPLLLLLLRLDHRRFTALVLAGLCLAILAWRCWLFAHGSGDALDRHLAMATDTRVDAILVGCLMGLFANPWLDRGARTPSSPGLLGARDLGIALLGVGVLLGTLAWRDEAFRATVRYTVQSLAIAPLLWLAVARADALPFRWLNAAPVAWLGRVSYTIYLSHQAVLFALESRAPALGWLLTTLLGAAITLVIAAAMHRFVEAPCAEWRRRLHRTSRAAPTPAPVAAARAA
ncbi:MAG TPA: acyltransferase [Nevskiaceae bacterium]|nr:acyltransferase [Nevskiaceae bacterium]